MNGEQFEKERLYQATMTVARAMCRKGLLTEDEVTIIDTKMSEKYQPLLGTLYPPITPN
jgi:hypothetical protein